MSNKKIIFILPNIYECVNGVSTKYIKFIEYLKKLSYNYVLFTTFKNNDIYNKVLNEFKINIIKTSGMTIPFYKDIKIPILSKENLKNEIKGDEIIVFNGEFIWLYSILKKFKNKYKNLKIYPTMHTDYIFYNEVFYKTYSIKSIINFLNISLENKNFDGIIVTGESMKEKYKDFTNNIFNANEVNLDIFNNVKKDDYISDYFNVIYCGRISKEKNIDEMLDCCLEMKKKYNIIIHFIGNGPYLDNLQNIIDIEYKDIKSKIIFHGNKSPEEINKLYQILDNRIFLFTSISETFGKTPMEAGATGIPIFLKKCEVNELLYINKKNAFIFDNKKDFIDQFSYFLDMNKLEKEIFISNSIENIKKYDQNMIFEDWIYFLMNGCVNKNKNKVNITILDLFTFHSISKLINCTGHIISD